MTGIGDFLRGCNASPEFRPQGFRIRINGKGAEAPNRALPPALWALFEATAHVGLNALDKKEF